MNRIKLNWLLAALAVFTLAACSGSEEQTTAKPAPVQFESGDECHVCGMIIEGFPGPKGQAITEKDQHVRKFCSTRDMFAWMLQPENINRDHTLYVHDMAQTGWQSPDDTALIDARAAFYVAGSDRTGAMGPTLASFATESSAHEFMREYGGQVLKYSEITLDHLIDGASTGKMSDMKDM
ncbi:MULTISPECIES: nitrous oxide reductase accessory protein NosL [Marinobacter]|uniref:Nitrous oxide reductase accessory protein NosL n=1 Tax=Marinobacter metalliresistant TaxID=2961995 RepID=A0ABZ2W6B2_9GAMM|nr:nitrous oxide reductase accessory protein NosL [Marinobacter sp. Arc7-DN-1]AXS82995.1 nitrous oxide reductase accessory protein NosL [Marinobacter sp. Arc7-DN-1]